VHVTIQDKSPLVSPFEISEYPEVEEQEEKDNFSQYFSDSNKPEDNPPVFSPELGLAVEQIHEGLTVQTLWHVQ
jgi:hypothetical protein